MGNFDQWLVALTALAAIGAGLVGGVFYAFSTFVMKALARLPAGEGLAAMQSINVAVINPAFMGLFLGTAVLCLLLPAGAWLRWDRPGTGWLLLGCGMYLIGTLGVTIVFNVPLNDALATLTRDDPAAAQQWARYLTVWTIWNHVRGVAAIGAMAAFGMAWRAMSVNI